MIKNKFKRIITNLISELKKGFERFKNDDNNVESDDDNNVETDNNELKNQYIDQKAKISKSRETWPGGPIG